jgi:fluoride ion exporter CrcB/FEX
VSVNASPDTWKLIRQKATELSYCYIYVDIILGWLAVIIILVVAEMKDFAVI